MTTFNFKELFSNQFRKDGTLKARNTIENDAPRGGRSGNHIVIVDKKLAEEVYNQFSAEY